MPGTRGCAGIGVSGVARIYSYQVPTDGKVYTHTMTGEIVGASGRAGAVEFYASCGLKAPTRRAFRVYRCGEPLPPDPNCWVHRQTVTFGSNVWHLIEHLRGK